MSAPRIAMRDLGDVPPLIPMRVLRAAAALGDEVVDSAVAASLGDVDANDPNAVLGVLGLMNALLALAARAAASASASIDAPGGTPKTWALRVDGEADYLREVLSVAQSVGDVLTSRSQSAGGAR